MRKLKRHPGFEVAVTLTADTFIAPPRQSQRNWLLNRAMAEFADDLVALDRAAARFIAGTDMAGIGDRTATPLADDEIMEDWQVPIMRAMSALVTASHGDVLEIGFGRGIASGFVQDAGVRSHTIVECNASVIERYHRWRAGRPGQDIRLIPGRWQDVTGQLGQYDGVFFHTYPLTDDEYMEQVVHSVTFAEHFFPTAAAHLRPGGAFTYLTNEMDSLSRGHQRLIFRHFTSCTMRLIGPLDIPPTSRDAFWGDAMVLVQAIK
jgi:guanidinoacetate N-methyltransferase